MTEFRGDRRRDASPTIRGFSYQIRSTVLRWLGLDGTTVLLCECGEDISEMRRCVDPTTGAVEVEQLLEQVKHRLEAVTLASREVVETLANFHHALGSQTGHRVLLRYTTNAQVGREQRYRFPDGRPGIEAWQRVTGGAADSAEVKASLAVFRDLIAGARAPTSRRGISRRLASFQSFVAGTPDEELVGFLARVEWAVGQPAHDLLQVAIEDELVRQGMVSPRGARAAAAKLVVVALDTLARGGQKPLHRALLVACLQDYQLSAAESALLLRLQRMEGNLALLPEVASDVRATRAIADGILQKLDGLLSAAAVLPPPRGGAPYVLAQLSPPVLDRPPLAPDPHVARIRVVDGLAAELEGTRWLHLRGGAGMGKTHLARALTERADPTSLLWVSLEGDADDEASLLAHASDQIVAWVCTVQGDPSWWQPYIAGRVSVAELLGSTLAKCPARVLVVVDSLPGPARSPRLWTALSGLVLACVSANARVLTTGQWSLSPQATAPLPPGCAGEAAVPPMDEADARAMMAATGVSTEIAGQGFPSLLASAAGGHPSILAAVVRWCAVREWRFDEGELLALLSGEAAAATREVAVQQMVRLVSDSDARELLYRLSLIGRVFGRRELEAVASVSPALPRPGELLLKLVGPWVDRLGDDRWQVSPLLGTSGGVLALSLQEGVHLALSGAIMASTPVSLPDAVQAAVHLLLAHAWADAAGLMIYIMSSVKTAPEAAAVWPLALVFTPGSTWPEQITLGRRMAVRAFQIRAAYLEGRDASDLQQDLDALLDSAGNSKEEQLGRVIALLNAGPFAPHAPPAVATRRALQAARLLRANAELALGLPPLLPNWEELVLFPLSRAEGLEDARDVLAVLEGMTTEELHAAFDSDLGTQCLQVMVGRGWTSIPELPESARDWDTVLGFLDDLERLSREHASERIETVARCARAAVLADHLSRAEDGLQALDGFEPADPVCQLLRHHTMACILFDLGRLPTCLAHLQDAVQAGGAGFSTQRFTAYRLATEACGLQGEWRRAIDWANRGIRYARSHRLGESEPGPPSSADAARVREPAHLRQALLTPFVTDLERLELTGELSLALWHAGERARSCGAMAGLVRELCVAWAPDDPRYREVFCKTGYVLLWLSSMSADGVPPAAQLEGVSYVAPWTGIFVRRRAGLADTSSPMSRPLLWYVLGVMAAGLGLRWSALKWLEVAASLATGDDRIHRPRVLVDLAVVSASLGRFRESLEAGLEATRFFAVLGGQLQSNSGAPELPASLAEAWALVPQERRCRAQQELFWFTVFPDALHVLLADHGDGAPGAWQEALTELRGELANPDYWDLVMGAAGLAISHGPRSELDRYLGTVRPGETALSGALGFALAEGAGARPEEAVCAHGALAAEMVHLGSITRFVLNDFCRYLASYWLKVAEAGAFRLRLPSQFRRRVARLPSPCDLASACQLILWAEEASGASLPPDVRMALQRLAIDRK